MAAGDDISDAPFDWATEELDLIPVEEERARFGRYVLGYEIASGGMGTVYLAREQGPGGFSRPVAIKRIHPHLARKRQFVEMFLDEARVAARITHPNVCSIYGFGDVGGTHYIAMEYLVGQPLSELAPRVAARPELAGARRWHALAARIVADASEGLHAAHELCDEHGQPLGIVHRDVSTHNVFVTYDGAVKVLDFGIARAHGRTHQTRTGTVKGKLAYMSPEQARASKEIDRRSDVWSLGVVLWELLALRRLFGRRSDLELLRAVAEEPIVPPSLVRPEVPPELDAVVLRALERDPGARYPSARALARDLGAFVSRSGEGTSLTDLSELLGELFEEERAGKLVAVAAVMHTDTSDRVVAEPQPPADTPPPPPPRLVRSSEAETHILDAPLPARDASAPDAGARAHPSRARPRTVAIVAAASLALIAAAAVAVAVVGGPDTEPERREAPAVEPRPTSGEDEGARAVPVPTPSPVEPAPALAAADARTVAQADAPEPVDVPTEPATPRREMGVVNVATSGGWADIYVRGRFVARTPHVVRLPAGQQTLELRPSGTGPPRRITVDVRPGATTRVVVPLSPPG